MMEKKELLEKYKKIWGRINEISKETDGIVKTSAYGQAPPIFHELVDKQLKIIECEALPIWEELKSYIRADFQTFWQYTNWRKGTLPPSYSELGIDKLEEVNTL